MAKGSKKQFKQFQIDSIEDACSIMASLISPLIIHLQKYKEYTREAVSLLKETDCEFVPAKEYEDINDKLLCRQHAILKLVADRQNSSFSYVAFRDFLVKKKYLSMPLSMEITQLLNELLSLRNWSFHNAQSQMVASKEVAKRWIPEEFRDSITLTYQLNPVIVTKIEKYELVMLVSLIDHASKRIEQYEKILAQMKMDYQEMIDSLEDMPLLLGQDGFSQKVQYVEQNVTMRLESQFTDASQISMAIQESKYDGSDESYHKHSIKGVSK